MVQEDISKQYLKTRSRLYQYIATAEAGLAVLQAGINIGWATPMLPYLTSEDSFVVVTEEQGSWIACAAGIGAIIGATPAGRLSDILGRRRAILTFPIFSLLSWLLMIFGTGVWSLYIARLLGGIACGSTFALTLTYIGEISESDIRGILSSTFGILIAIGTFVSYIAGTFLSFRTFSILGACLVLLFYALSPFLVESPTWLVQQGRMVEAGSLLARLRGDAQGNTAELALLQKDADTSKSQGAVLKKLWQSKAGRRALITCVGLIFFQQLSGIDPICVYAVSILRAAGSTIDPFVAIIILAFMTIVMEICTGVVIDRTGRRPLLLSSSLGMMPCLVILGFCYQMKGSTEAEVLSIGWLPLFSLIMHTFFYSIGFAGVPWIMNGELFPPETKSVGCGVIAIVNMILSSVMIKIFPIMVGLVGMRIYFLILAGFMVVGAIFVFIFVPETKGKTLQRIQSILRGQNPYTYQRKARKNRTPPNQPPRSTP
ncbi:facilitated trehalose transporter Tret1-2 homolog [Athalia rosae]|uniref:facilitated trehalose transporter Tret1-2 homolog n=1 Tax=Athalia rosae TaxID=37344 RepID=UPI0020340058|nr:facilitated trehalose transporter Tret1-2 homolog [Athalia rosae]